MSALDDSGEVQRISGVKIAQNAKGEAQVTVHVYVGTSDDELTKTRDQAILLYNETCKAVRG